MSIRDPVPGQHVFVVNIFRNPDKASSCNAYHRSAENDKRQACHVAKFLPW